MVLNLQAQEPEPIYSFALSKESPEYYKEQIKAWKAVTVKEPKNGIAWYNYYYATRNLQRTDTNDKRADSVKTKEMLNLVEEMGKAIPNSYEYHLCMWKEHANDPEFEHHLTKVYELGEGRIEHIDFIINDGEFERDIEKRNKALIRKWEAGLISPGMANYNRNVLAGLSPNAILLTTGDNDTYPAWYVQATGFRQDVKVINLHLLAIDKYREQICKELGIDPIEIDWHAKSAENPDHFNNFYSKLIPALSSNSKDYELYIALTAVGNAKLIEGHDENLYMTGLAYQYCEITLDERALLKRNFEQLYALDYLQTQYYHDISSGLVPQINTNYIVPMLKLYEHYKLSGDLTQLEWIKPYLINISKGTDAEEVVNNIIK